jgi:hypothetical protein
MLKNKSNYKEWILSIYNNNTYQEHQGLPWPRLLPHTNGAVQKEHGYVCVHVCILFEVCCTSFARVYLQSMISTHERVICSYHTTPTEIERE